MKDENTETARIYKASVVFLLKQSNGAVVGMEWRSLDIQAT